MLKDYALKTEQDLFKEETEAEDSALWREVEEVLADEASCEGGRLGYIMKSFTFFFSKLSTSADDFKDKEKQRKNQNEKTKAKSFALHSGKYVHH